MGGGCLLYTSYTEEDITRIIESRELFFMETPLHIIKRRSKLYKMFFEFDQQCGLPQTVQLPVFQRGYVVLSDGTVRWYKKRRNDNRREFVDELTPEFLELSPDNFWSFPDLCEFLESGKKISDYV